MPKRNGTSHPSTFLGSCAGPYQSFAAWGIYNTKWTSNSNTAKCSKVHSQAWERARAAPSINDKISGEAIQADGKYRQDSVSSIPQTSMCRMLPNEHPKQAVRGAFSPSTAFAGTFNPLTMASATPSAPELHLWTTKDAARELVLSRKTTRCGAPERHSVGPCPQSVHECECRL